MAVKRSIGSVKASAAALIITIAVLLVVAVQEAHGAVQNFTITTPASVGPNAPEPGAGDIENPGDVDIYTVSNAAPAERLFVVPGEVTPDQAGRGCDWFQWALKDGAGNVLARATSATPAARWS